MIQFILGLILVIAPFYSIKFFTDKKQGFVYVLFYNICFFSIVSLALQTLHIFYYWVFMPLVFIAESALFYFLYTKYKDFSVRNFKIDWALFVIVLISLATLYQAHYNYTGKISLATDGVALSHNVKNMAYPYPYYSDEWDTISFINYCIGSHSLPFINPLNNSSYINFAAPFFSFLSGIVLILGLNPLLSYNFLAIAINTLIICLCYFFLRQGGVSKGASAVCSLALLYIACSANLPGIWHLIPIHLAIVLSLLGFYFIAARRAKSASLAALAILLFYPPLILFYGLGFVVFLASMAFKGSKNAKIILWVIASLVILTCLTVYFSETLSIKSSLFLQIYSLIDARLFFQSFSGEYIAQYNFYDVIPVLSIVFALLGAFYALRKYKWLIMQLLLGVGFWILYSKANFRIIIDYERVILFTSIIVVILSGFGIKVVEDFLVRKFRLVKTFKSIYALALIAFIIMIPVYTKLNPWEKFYLINPKTNTKAYPRAPANNYLVQDDLNLFKGISGKRFLSQPWKGLVIGVATSNYPVVAKDGIISVVDNSIIDKFLSVNCNQKLSLATRRRIDYIYLYNIDCDGFEKIGQSKEGFALYKTKIN